MSQSSPSFASYSVVVPVYNREDSILPCLHSIASQTVKPAEIIVVDDGCSDRTAERVRNCPLDVKLVATEGRTGACNARNVGIRNAASEVIAFQDSDDIWLPGKMSLQLTRMREGRYAAVFSSFIKLRSSEVAVGGRSRVIAAHGEARLDDLLSTNYVSTQTIVVEKELINRVQGFDVEMKRFQDWDLAIRLAQRGPIGYLDEPTVIVHEQGQRISTNRSNGVHSRLRLLEKYKILYDDDPSARSSMLFSLALRQARLGQWSGAAKSISVSLASAARHIYPSRIRSTTRR